MPGEINSVIFRIMRIAMNTSPYLLPNGTKITAVKPLGRWCHLEYSNTCDVNKKIDLANSDNSFHVKDVGRIVDADK